MKFTGQRNQHGAMMGLIIAAAIVFIIFAVGMIQLSMLFGGSREIANATDAATLNTGRLATTVTVDTQGGDESQYNDVAENGKSFSLKSINRMWAKCMLCMMNAKEMQDDGYSSGDSNSHADSLYSAAKSISDRLADKLNTPSTLQPFFDQMAHKETVKMLGDNAGATSDMSGGWSHSLMDRGVESNIAVYDGQLPGSFGSSPPPEVKCSDNNMYFPGYQPFSVLGHDVTFVPFKFKAQPHLSSQKEFTSNVPNTNPIQQWQDPIANAYSCQGKTLQQKEGVQGARAFVLTNPQKTYDLVIPQSYIHIKLDTNTCHFYFNATPYPIYDQTYDYSPPGGPIFTAQSGTMDAGAAVATATVTPLGQEFEPPTIWQALTALSNFGGSYSNIKNLLVQRCSEMKHGFQESDLESVLSTLMIPQVTDYYIYPTFDSNNNATINVAPSLSNPFPPSWVLSSSGADGDDFHEVDSNGDTSLGLGLPAPPFVPIVEVEGIGGGSGVMLECDSVKWKAGTGYNACLGEVKVSHDLYAQCFGGGFI